MTTHPSVLFSHNGVRGVRLRETNEDEVRALQQLHERCSDFIELISGGSPAPDEARALMKALPPGKAQEDKFVIGLVDDAGDMFGVADVIREGGEELLG